MGAGGGEGEEEGGGTEVESGWLCVLRDKRGGDGWRAGAGEPAGVGQGEERMDVGRGVKVQRLTVRIPEDAETMSEEEEALWQPCQVRLVLLLLLLLLLLLPLLPLYPPPLPSSCCPLPSSCCPLLPYLCPRPSRPLYPPPPLPYDPNKGGLPWRRDMAGRSCVHNDCR
eukprot:703568-Hanusia_phi.AAC.1